MLSIPQLDQLLWYFSLFLNAALLWRLYHLGVIRRYPALAFCMAIQAVRSLPLLNVDVNTDAYAERYMATVPVLLGSYIWVALEIYAQTFEAYRGLAAVSRKVMLGVLACGATIAVAIHLNELNVTGEPFQPLRAVLLVESATCLTVLILLLTVAAFLLWYPANVRKNLLLYSFCFSVYMATQCYIVFLRNTDPNGLTRIASMARLAVENLSLLALVVFFQKAWEQQHRPSVAHLTSEHKRKLLAQIDNLNDALEGKRKFTRAS